MPFCKNAFLFLAQMKPNGNLRLLVVLAKTGSLIPNEYTNNSHRLDTLSQHMEAKLNFCKLECSHAKHSLQMLDRRSIEMPAFKITGGTMAYKKTCARSQEIPFCIFKVHAGVIRTSGRGRPFCSIRGR